MDPVLYIIWGFLLLIGIAYAAVIYFHPPREGATWVSVVIGDAGTDLGTMAATYIILNHFGLLVTLGWWLIPLPVISHVITGLPMIVGQVLHEHQQRSIVENLRNGNGESKHSTLA